jgi:hypothetical protein
MEYSINKTLIVKPPQFDKLETHKSDTPTFARISQKVETQKLELVTAYQFEGRMIPKGTKAIVKGNVITEAAVKQLLIHNGIECVLLPEHLVIGFEEA